MKRYAIVRVDDNCPFMQEKLDFSSCSKMFNCDKFIRCEKCEHNCRYGDTKEQMVLKVSQALKMDYEERTGNYGYSLKFYEPMAKFIVEFLGVEE